MHACNSTNSSDPRRTRTTIDVSFFLNASWRIFCTPLLPPLNGDWYRICDFAAEPIRSSSTMSPLCSMSPVHSSAFELPLRHSMESTFGSRVGESELLCDVLSMIMLTLRNAVWLFGLPFQLHRLRTFQYTRLRWVNQQSKRALTKTN